MINTSPQELAAKARQESHVNLSIAAHYAQLAMGFLEIADDDGARYALVRFRENTVAALREFKAVRTLVIDQSSGAAE